MKKLLSILIFILCFSSLANAATITATKAGNWSDTTVWDLGRIPAAGDDVALAGYAIVWDSGARIPATSGTLTSITSTGTAGQITLDLSSAFCNSGCSLNATKIQAGAGKATWATTGILLISGTTANVLTINTGTKPNGIVGGSGATGYPLTINHQGTGTINVIGDIIGNNNTYGIGFINASTGAVNVTGNMYQDDIGAGCRAFGNNSTGVVTVNGNLTGGYTGTSADAALYNASTGSVIVNSGIITGGNNCQGFGLFNYSSGHITFVPTVILVYGTKGPPYGGLAPAWQPTSGGYKFYYGTGFGQAANTLTTLPIARVGSF
jgi:hypothetical protein